MQKVNDPPAKQCPKCFEDSVIKLVSAAGFQLKGDGWYATDFKDKGKPPSKTDDKKNEDAGKTVPDTKKPESKKTEDTQG